VAGAETSASFGAVTRSRLGLGLGFALALASTACSKAGSGIPDGAGADEGALPSASTQARVPPDRPTTHTLVPREDAAVRPKAIELSARRDRAVTVEEEGKSCRLRVRTLPERKQTADGEVGCDASVQGFSPDGTKIVVVHPSPEDGEGKQRWSVLEATTLALVKGGVFSTVRRMVWGPKGILIEGGGGVRLLDPESGSEKVVNPGHAELAPDGLHFVVETRVEAARASPEGKHVARFGYELFQIEQAAGMRLSFAGANAKVHFSDSGVVLHGLYTLHPYTNAGVPAAPLEIGFAGSGPSDLSADGKTYGVVDGNYNLWLYDLESGHRFIDSDVDRLLRLWLAGSVVHGLGESGLVSWDVVPR
jgi:hypothetical protein